MALGKWHQITLPSKEFQDMLKVLELKCPTVAEYDYNSDNTRQIVYESALKKGFELCLAHLRAP